jgi:hypothetical protein
MTFLSNVMKIDSAVLLICVLIHVIKWDCLWTDIPSYALRWSGIKQKRALFTEDIATFTNNVLRWIIDIKGESNDSSTSYANQAVTCRCKLYDSLLLWIFLKYKLIFFLLFVAYHDY